MKPSIDSIIAFAHSISTRSIQWNPKSWNSSSIWTPCLINNFINSYCRSNMKSPQNPITRHLPSLLMALVCGPSNMGLQYQWSRFSPFGKQNSQTKSCAHKGSKGSAEFCSSEFVLTMPPNRGWFIIFPTIFKGANSIPIASNAAKNAMFPPLPCPYR